MSNHAVGQGAAGLSIFLGVLIMAGSALFLDDWRKPFEDCKTLVDMYGGSVHEDCRPFLFFVAGAGAGIVAGILQLLFSILGFLKKVKAWALVQLLVLVLIVIALGLPIWERAYDIEDFEVPGYHSVERWRAFAFLGLAAVDGIITLILIPVVFLSS